MSGSRKNRRGSNALFTVLFITLFLIGLVIGMLIVHIAETGRRETLIADYEGRIKELKEKEKILDETTRVYVPERKRIFGKMPKNSYNIDNFVIDNGFMAYYDDDGNKLSHLGVDLSYHQQSVNWDELKASPVEFVMLRCGYRGYSEGGLIMDEKFREYASKCNEYDIPLGVYFFTQAVTVEEAVKEAEFVIDAIKDFDISYPVAFDTEYVSEENARTNLTEISDRLRTDMIKAFCDRVKEEGYYPMFYASENWVRRNMYFEELADYDLWAAMYMEENDFLFDHTIWQYTSQGNIPGIDTEVDLNISMVDYSEFVPALRKAFLENGVIGQTEASDWAYVIEEEENGAGETESEENLKDKAGEADGED
ncbi:MAG: glycoside hydrolase family 25 protein [Lachnospiraceae bacterium]|nr:glycoside hydrolase family 25 protein [Lachnospiraceae bacterium]